MNTRKVGRSKRAISLKQDIETHDDGHAAINVKYYGPSIESNLSPIDSNYAWESVVEQFWEQAKDIAHEHGYSGVFSEGRSGGWLVPFYQTTSAGISKFHNWPGQGRSLGYPSFPDMEDKIELSRFRTFRFDIEQLLASVPDMIKDAIGFQQELENDLTPEQ